MKTNAERRRDMADKELKKLNRRELISIIYELAKENEKLSAEIGELKSAEQHGNRLIDAAGSNTSHAV